MRVVNLQLVEDKNGNVRVRQATETHGFVRLPGESTNKRNELRSLKRKFVNNLVSGLR